MIRLLLRLYTVLLVVEAIMSYFPETIKYSWRKRLKQMCDYTCAPMRKFMPKGLPFDLSPIIVIFLIYICISVFTYLW